jgi:hypothetical protein
MERFGLLPVEVMHLVLAFYGKITYIPATKYSNARYISELPGDDPRYGILTRIPLQKPMFGTSYPRLFREHFQTKVDFSNRKYELFWYNVQGVPDRIFFFMYKPDTTSRSCQQVTWTRL